MHYRITFLLLFISFILVGGCSSQSQNPINVSNTEDLPFNLPVSEDSLKNDRLFLGSWTMEIDLESNSAIAVPNRDINAHFNIRTLIPDPIIVLNGFNPITQVLDVDLIVQNPFLFDAYDFRLIVYTDAVGHLLLNADSWTDLFDIPGGLPVNPFKAYGKHETNRRFRGNNFYQENYQIKCPGGNFFVNFTMEASYPSNCLEPYEIRDISMGTLNDHVGSQTNVSVNVLDWQSDTSSVQLYCPPITGTALVDFAPAGSNRWNLTLTNQTGAPAGEYMAFIVAKSAGSGSLALYNKLDIQIRDETFSGWAKSWGGAQVDFGQAVIVDNQRNIIVSGGFSGTDVDFNPGSGTDLRSSKGQLDAYVTKFSPTGDYQWSGSWGASRDDTATGLAFDSFDSIYVVGKFVGTVDFDPGSGTTIRNPAGTFGTSDIYLSKLTSNGQFSFVKNWGGSNVDDEALDVTIDSSGNVYVTGYFRGQADFNTDVGPDNKTSKGGTDIFVSKFHSNGSYQWAKTWGGTADLAVDRGKSVTTDRFGNVYVLGEFANTVDFDPDQGTTNKTAAGAQDVFISKFDSTGQFQWVQTWGNNTSGDQDQGNSVVSDGNFLYITGIFGGTVDFNPGSGVAERTSAGPKAPYLLCLDLSGNFMWVQTWGGSSVDNANDLTIDNNGRIYVTGDFFSSDCDFDPGPGIVQFGSKGFNDIYVSRFESNGTFVWAQTWGAGQSDRGLGIAVDEFGLVYTAGDFSQTVDFDPSPGNDDHISNGVQDAFLLKVLSNGRWF